VTRWLPIRGFEGRYEISDSGDVRGLVPSGRGRSGTATLLRLGTTGTGYRQVFLYPGGGARPVARRIHQLVLEHFVGPRPPGAVGRHLNDDRLDNRFENLAWGSESQNALDMVRNGNHNHARKTHCKWGHPFDGANLARTIKQRVCRECARRRNEEYERRRAIAVFVADQQAGITP
jgi:hypothetical protein